MSEISEQDARKAAKRVTNAYGWLSSYASRPPLEQHASIIRDIRQASSDVLVLWAIEELSRRDAAQAARQQPITHEWCEANGAELSCEWYWFGEGVSLRPIAGEKWLVVVNSRMLDWSAECVGQVEDLRKALRGGA